jgi:hypothetical protein
MKTITEVAIDQMDKRPKFCVGERPFSPSLAFCPHFQSAEKTSRLKVVNCCFLVWKGCDVSSSGVFVTERLLLLYTLI